MKCNCKLISFVITITIIVACERTSLSNNSILTVADSDDRSASKSVQIEFRPCKLDIRPRRARIIGVVVTHVGCAHGIGDGCAVFCRPEIVLVVEKVSYELEAVGDPRI